MESTHPKLLRRLIEDHVHLVKVLRVLSTEMAKLEDHDAEVDFYIVGCTVDYISRYPDAFHHPLEDIIFAELDEVDLLPEERRALDQNVKEHEEIHAATTTVSADIDRILNVGIVPAKRLRQHVEAYVDLQLDHLRREQEMLFPLAERLFSEQTWRDLYAKSPLRNDPLFNERLSEFDGLYGYIAAMEG